VDVNKCGNFYLQIFFYIFLKKKFPIFFLFFFVYRGVDFNQCNNGMTLLIQIKCQNWVPKSFIKMRNLGLFLVSNWEGHFYNSLVKRLREKSRIWVYSLRILEVNFL
jgi:hypothetical protein